MLREHRIIRYRNFVNSSMVIKSYIHSHKYATLSHIHSSTASLIVIQDVQGEVAEDGQENRTEFKMETKSSTNSTQHTRHWTTGCVMRRTFQWGLQLGSAETIWWATPARTMTTQTTFWKERQWSRRTRWSRSMPLLLAPLTCRCCVRLATSCWPLRSRNPSSAFPVPIL